MVKKNQILMIHGGMTFKNRKDYLNFLNNRKVSIEKKKKWEDDFEARLQNEFEIIRPHMPLKENAKYEEWKIYFERFVPHIRNNVILIGVSLGAIFLAKYLSEHKFPKKIISVYLICPPFDNNLPGEDLVGGFKLKSDLSLLEKNCKNLNLLFSKNDDVVPISHAKKYQQKLKNANIIIYRNMNGHFVISKFSELINIIRRDKN